MLGAGTQSDPYIVKTPDDLNNVRNNLTASYQLGNDIDMSSWGNWNPISFYDGNNWVNGFSGNFDGKGFRIKNLTVNKNNNEIYLGLFGQFHNGTLQNVGMENVQINTNNAGNCSYAGSLVGFSYGATIKNCFSINGSVKAKDESGGLIGKIDTGIVHNCYSSNQVTITSEYYGGGLIGSVDSNSVVRNSYSSGRVIYTNSSSYNGKSGFAGFIRSNSNILFENCFFDKQSSNQETSPTIGISGKTTIEMKNQSTYTNWDFTNTWLIKNDYPSLRAFGVPIVANKGTISVNAYTNSTNSLAAKSQKSVKQLETFQQPVYTNSERHIATLRLSESYGLPIFSVAEKSTRTVRSGQFNVITFINPISSSVERKSKTFKHLLSSLSPLGSDISVLYPLSTRVINAHVYALETPSRAYMIENISKVSYMENPSSWEVID
ncbi:hypothetical protein [Bacillus sp. SJS]|uniref:hypothetical protein n=1 Tax=Bacillus sp. SJS TaxID=1423321 RepID=UPI0004DCE6C2|nr:hypothetical protein [Bacillus sp. SJS]KZZ85648.1 hypothetical protein AS29_003405 [Bacillus sp. SJS]